MNQGSIWMKLAARITRLENRKPVVEIMVFIAAFLVSVVQVVWLLKYS